eukprot:5323495-Pleurochrysis_carterae.AAC.1
MAGTKRPSAPRPSYGRLNLKCRYQNLGTAVSARPCIASRGRAVQDVNAQRAHMRHACHARPNLTLPSPATHRDAPPAIHLDARGVFAAS